MAGWQMAEVATQKLIGDMGDAQFDALIEQFIRRRLRPGERDGMIWRQTYAH